MIDGQPLTTEQVAVPFFLDDMLGPNTAYVMLVMCEFEVAFTGTFTVEVTDTTFRITHVNLEGAPFALPFPDGFIARIENLRVSRNDVEPSIGRLRKGDGDHTDVRGTVPLTVDMDVVMPGDRQHVRFHPTLQVAGSLVDSAIHLQGSFDFLMEGYDEPEMPTKFGTCVLWLSATSQLHARLSDSSIALTFAGRSARLHTTGWFTFGLDAINVRVLALEMQSTPYELAFGVELTDIEVRLEDGIQPPNATFTPKDRGNYDVQARVPVTLQAQMKLFGGQPQPLQAQLYLYLSGTVSLNEYVTLALQDSIEVFIADGSVKLDLEAQLHAEIALLGDVSPELDERRATYQHLAQNPQCDDLRAALAAADPTLRWLAVRLLVECDGVVDELRAMLNDDSAQVRVEAINALPDYTHDLLETDLIPILTERITTREYIAVLQLASKMPGNPWQALAKIAVDHDESVVRAVAVEVIAQHGDREWLRKVAHNDENPFVRLSAAAALLSTDPGDDVVRVVLDIVDRERDVCLLMIGSLALGETRNPKHWGALAHLMRRSDDPFVTEAIRHALANRPPDGGKA